MDTSIYHNFIIHFYKMKFELFIDVLYLGGILVNKKYTQIYSKYTQNIRFYTILYTQKKKGVSPREIRKVLRKRNIYKVFIHFSFEI